jgi:probable phosphoglycerate mutase
VAVELVLVRHCATTAVDELVGGQSDPPLSDLGRDQAHRVARRLADEDVHGLFVTPLRRTADTAAPLADASGCSTTIVEALREVHLGEREATLRTSDGQRSLMREVLAAGRWDVAPGAEPMAKFGARVGDGLADVARTIGETGRAVAVGEHGLTLRVYNDTAHLNGTGPMS